MGHTVECLLCGFQREVREHDDDCPRCRYVGWASVVEVTEELRHDLRERPLEQRRFLTLTRETRG